MKELKNKKKVLVLILSIFLIFITACTNQSKNDEKDNSYEFEQDLSLSKFINPSIQKDVFESNIGAVPPKVAFVNDDYVGILNYNGLLIYSINDEKLSSAIDIKGLGFDKIQGDGAIDISSNNEYLVLSKIGENKGYVYSFKDNYLSKVDDISKIKSLRVEYLDLDESKHVKSKIKENSEDAEIIKTENGYVVLILDYNNLKESCLIKVDKNYSITEKFKIS